MKVLFLKGFFFWIATKTQRHKGVTLSIGKIAAEPRFREFFLTLIVSKRDTQII
jgi:hypothetical protein